MGWKRKLIAPLVTLALGVGGMAISYKIAQHYDRKVEEVTSRLVSHEKSMRERIIAEEGTLSNYNKYLELRERYAPFEREESKRGSELARERGSYIMHQQSATVGFVFSSCIATSPFVSGISQSLKKRFKRKSVV